MNGINKLKVIFAESVGAEWSEEWSCWVQCCHSANYKDAHGYRVAHLN